MPIDALISAGKNILDKSGAGKPLDPSTSRSPIADYTIVGKEANWFKALPYAFKATINKKPKIFYLPINPSNLTITTHYATNVIATLYGTVEEHSEVRYFDINIAGTTGFSPQYSSEIAASNSLGTPNQGRTAYGSGEVFSNLAGGFFKQTLGKLDAALNSARDTVNAIRGTSNKFQPGVSNKQSGYVAFHNLYKFFLDYKRSTTGGDSSSVNLPKSAASAVSSIALVGASAISSAIGSGQSSGNQTPLLFLNYKDNNQYSVVVQNFTLEKSTENPMLYNYRITMRGYNLSTINSAPDAGSYLTNRLAALGLGDGAASIASRFKNGVKGGRATLNNLKGALGSLGR
jgi:hypothetical protein